MKWFELPAPDPASAAPAFTDAAGARAWLARLPQAMPSRMQTAIAEQIELLARAALPAGERAALLDALRGPAFTAQQAVRRKFAFAPRPIGGDAQAGFVASARLWTALADGYLRCLEDFADAGGLQSATAAHRAVVISRLALEDHFVAGVEAPPELWQRVQRLIQVAGMLGVAQTAVADAELHEPAASTAAEQYVLVALLALADPYRWTAGQFAVAHRALSRWRGQAPLAAADSDDPKLRWVPLTAVAELPPSPGAGAPAWLEVHQVRRKLRKRIEAIAGGAAPETLRLGRELSAGACTELLNSILDHLRAAYSEAGSRMLATDAPCEIAVGPLDCFRLLAGRPFSDDETLSATSARILHDRIAIFGASERVEAIAAATRSEGEPWRLIADAADAAVIVREAWVGGATMLPGQIIVVRDERGSAALAVVARAWTRHDGPPEIRLRRLPGKPEARTGYAVNLPTLPAFPLFVLPAIPAVGSGASLLLPSGIASRLKYGLETRGEPQLRCKLGALIERGSDFERYVVQPI